MFPFLTAACTHRNIHYRRNFEFGGRSFSIHHGRWWWWWWGSVSGLRSTVSGRCSVSRWVPIVYSGLSAGHFSTFREIYKYIDQTKIRQQNFVVTEATWNWNVPMQRLQLRAQFTSYEPFREFRDLQIDQTNRISRSESETTWNVLLYNDCNYKLRSRSSCAQFTSWQPLVVNVPTYLPQMNSRTQNYNGRDVELQYPVKSVLNSWFDVAFRTLEYTIPKPWRL